MTGEPRDEGTPHQAATTPEWVAPAAAAAGPYEGQQEQDGQPGLDGHAGYDGQPGYYGQPSPSGQPSHYGQPGYAAPLWTPPPVPDWPARARHRRRVVVGSVAAAAVTAVAVGTVAVLGTRANNASQQTAVTAPNTATNPFGANGQAGSGSGTLPQFGWGNGFGGDGSGSDGTGSGSGSSGSGGSSNTTGSATTAQQVGVVDINTVLNYGEGKAAGTGIVLSSSGEILTNNHVVQDSTAISVTVVSTGKTYTATVVGTDPTDDVAVIQLKDASGLATAKLGNSTTVKVGDKVTAVGNAGGTGGTPSSATGSVTALGQSITASDSNGSNAERLTDMIQIDAAIEAGDSGGPLYNSAGAVVGIDTAASSARAATGTVGFAIPIAKAVTIADQIQAGQETATIHIGLPAFLGVQLSGAAAATGTSGATVAGVVDGSAAAKAGLSAGDTITSVNGTKVSSTSVLSSVMGKLSPGAQAKIGWADSSGHSHSKTVALGSGPAD